MVSIFRYLILQIRHSTEVHLTLFDCNNDFFFSDNFMMFKNDVAKQAINSRSGKPIPPKVCDWIIFKKIINI